MTEEMTAKEYLGQIHKAERKIKELQEEIKTLKELAVSTGAISQGERVQSSGSQDKMADTVCLINDKIGEWQQEIQKFVELRASVMVTISKIKNSDYEQVLYKRYCQMKKWEEIAVEMNVSFRHVTRMHGNALIEIEKALNMS